MRHRLAGWMQVPVLIALATGLCLAQDGEEIALQAGIKKETVDGDLPGAIQIYEKIVRLGRSPLAIAKARLHIGACHEKLGDFQAAARVYEEIIAEGQRGGQRAADVQEPLQEAWKRLVALLSAPKPSGTGAGWYNGDWQSNIPGLSNWYASAKEYVRVYDDIVVPEGGWTVTSVFSNNRMDFTGVTRASWEIRSFMSAGEGGTLVASGLSPATQTVIPGSGPFPRDPLVGYRIQVDDLHVQLAPGRYWLSVSPVGKGQSYASATKGRNAVGNPPGNNGLALFTYTLRNYFFQEAETIGRGGQLGHAKDFSMGVIIAKSSK
jgi:hypothetical protein